MQVFVFSVCVGGMAGVRPITSMVMCFGFDYFSWSKVLYKRVKEVVLNFTISTIKIQNK